MAFHYVASLGMGTCGMTESWVCFRMSCGHNIKIASFVD